MKNKNRILMYHSIGVDGSNEVGSKLYSVSVENFKQQMTYISKRNNDKEGPWLPLTVTFDDGNITNFINAYPILNKFNIKAYFFIIISKVGVLGYMDWQQIRQLKDSGMIIGSHGISHRNMAGLSDSEIDCELSESKRTLEENLEQKVDYFSVPFGFYNKKILEKVRKAGYKGMFTSKFTDNDGFKFGRIAVRRNWDLNYFAKVINSGLSITDRSRELIKHTSKRVLGANNYDRFRAMILKKQKLEKLPETIEK